MSFVAQDSPSLNPYKKSQFALYRMRSKIFDYPETQEKRASRVLHYLKERMLRGRKIEKQNEQKGAYSGLTRTELRATGTCETDWF